MIADLYNLKNERTGSVELPDRVFKVKWNPDLVHQALRAQLSNSRSQTAHTKGRGEVRGGGKKPWKQKGTGRARHGSIRSPLWKGGGVTHGPTKEKKYELKINKKMKQRAIFSLLSRRLHDGEIKIVESLQISEPKTKSAKIAIDGLFERNKKSLPAGRQGKLSALLIPAAVNKNIYKATRNLVSVKALNPKSLNIYDLLKYKIILLDKEAVETINKHYHEIK